MTDRCAPGCPNGCSNIGVQIVQIDQMMGADAAGLARADMFKLLRVADDDRKGEFGPETSTA